MPTQPLPRLSQCVAPELQRFAERARENTNIQATLEGDVYNYLFRYGDITNPVTYYTNTVETPGSVFVPRYMPPLKIQLTTKMGATVAGQASAKIRYWDPGSSAYALSSTAFTVYDVLGKYTPAQSGDKGLLGYDAERGVLFPYDLSTAFVRRGTIGTVLRRYDSPSSTNGTATFTDSTSGVTVTVYGILIKDGWKIPTSARVEATWWQEEQLWSATAIDDCYVKV